MDHSWGYGSERRLRSENQDSFGVFEFPDFTLAIVCDGMGGHVGGAQASSLAVRTVHDALRDADPSDIPAALLSAVQAANLAIHEAARKNHRLMGMGTTLVAAAMTDEVAWFAHVGDSRAYLVRGRQVRQMTRDHTMVNLFVDAELLTPEDAATHPEAHVLSRSLGVERQVEVEISHAVPLDSEDVIFLCSDGVHGVITDWELGNVDWGAPNEGVRHILDIVISREGDDNATAVAVLCATSFEDVPATPAPEPKRLEESVAEAGIAMGVTAVPIEEGQSTSSYFEEVEPEPLRATPLPAPAENQGSYVVYDEAPKQDQKAQASTKNKPAGAKPDRKRILALGGLLVVVLCAGLGVRVVGSLGGGSAEAPGKVATDGAGEPTDAPIAEISVSGDPAVVPAPALVDAAPAGATAPVEAPPALLFAPTLPPPPRRLPHRPVRYTQPPPGGPTQWEAVQAARNHECAAALDAVAKGMRMSIDHATLYSQAWFCFNEDDQRPLADAKAPGWDQFAALLPHFDGPPEMREELPEEVRKLPTWYQPAVGGIEYRLLAHAQSTREDKFAEVMADLLGEAIVADNLAIDMLLEATAAEGLRGLPEPTEAQIDAWARRVFVLQTVMGSKTGRLLETHRPEVMATLREKLALATTPLPPPVDPDADPKKPVKVKAPELPVQVALARDVALGTAPPPTGKQQAAATSRPRPVAPLEPDLEDLQDFDRAKVYRKE